MTRLIENEEDMHHYLDMWHKSAHNQLLVATEYAIKFLTIINGGAIIATLAYLSEAKVLHSSLICSLILFGLGLIFVGFIVCYRFFALNGLVKKIANANQSLHESDVSALDTYYNKINRYDFYSEIVGVFSFILFIIGFIISSCFFVFAS